MLTKEQRRRLYIADRPDLIQIDIINQSGYAGILGGSGRIVDRRQFPNAIPVPENSIFGIPAPKSLDMTTTINYKDRKHHLLKVYPYIVAWGQSLGSFGYYIEMQVSKAIEDKAPEDAIYFDEHLGWHTVSGSPRKGLKEELDRYIKGEAGGLIPYWFEHEDDIPDNLKPLYGNS